MTLLYKLHNLRFIFKLLNYNFKHKHIKTILKNINFALNIN